MGMSVLAIYAVLNNCHEGKFKKYAMPFAWLHAYYMRLGDV